MMVLSGGDGGAGRRQPSRNPPTHTTQSGSSGPVGVEASRGTGVREVVAEGGVKCSEEIAAIIDLRTAVLLRLSQWYGQKKKKRGTAGPVWM